MNSRGFENHFRGCKARIREFKSTGCFKAVSDSFRGIQV